MVLSSWRMPSAFACALAATALLLLNLYGELLPERHPKAVEFVPNSHDPTLISAEEALAQLDALSRSWDSLSFDERMVRTTDIIAKGIVHYWPQEGEYDPHLETSLFENFLYFLRYRLRGEFAYYEYDSYRKTLQRGVGLCSQASRAVSDYLREEHGIIAGVIELDGHVVAYAEDPASERTVLLDADYNVYLPFDLAHAEANPDAVAAVYASHGFPAETIALLTGIYSESGNLINPPTRYRGRAKRFRTTEYITWLLPGTLLAVAGGLTLLARRGAGSARNASTETSVSRSSAGPRLTGNAKPAEVSRLPR